MDRAPGIHPRDRPFYFPNVNGLQTFGGPSSSFSQTHGHRRTVSLNSPNYAIPSAPERTRWGAYDDPGYVNTTARRESPPALPFESHDTYGSQQNNIRPASPARWASYGNPTFSQTGGSGSSYYGRAYTPSAASPQVTPYHSDDDMFDDDPYDDDPEFSPEQSPPASGKRRELEIVSPQSAQSTPKAPLRSILKNRTDSFDAPKSQDDSAVPFALERKTTVGKMKAAGHRKTKSFSGIAPFSSSRVPSQDNAGQQHQAAPHPGLFLAPNFATAVVPSSGMIPPSWGYAPTGTPDHSGVYPPVMLPPPPPQQSLHQVNVALANPGMHDPSRWNFASYEMTIGSEGYPPGLVPPGFDPRNPVPDSSSYGGLYFDSNSQPLRQPLANYPHYGGYGPPLNPSLNQRPPPVDGTWPRPTPIPSLVQAPPPPPPPASSPAPPPAPIPRLLEVGWSQDGKQVKFANNPYWFSYHAQKHVPKYAHDREFRDYNFAEAGISSMTRAIRSTHRATHAAPETPGWNGLYKALQWFQINRAKDLLIDPVSLSSAMQDILKLTEDTVHDLEAYKPKSADYSRILRFYRTNLLRLFFRVFPTAECVGIVVRRLLERGVQHRSKHCPTTGPPSKFTLFPDNAADHYDAVITVCQWACFGSILVQKNISDEKPALEQKVNWAGLFDAFQRFDYTEKLKIIVLDPGVKTAIDDEQKADLNDVWPLNEKANMIWRLCFVFDMAYGICNMTPARLFQCTATRKLDTSLTLQHVLLGVAHPITHKRLGLGSK